MNYTYPITTLELGIPIMTSGITLISIMIYFYIYIKLYEQIQLAILWVGICSFIFSMLDSINLIIGGLGGDISAGLKLYSLEQIIISYTIIPWLLYLKNGFILNKKIHSVVDKLKNIAVPALIFITIVAILFPDLFISITNPLANAGNITKQANISRGAVGPIYFFRDGLITIFFAIVIFCFIYEIFVNKKYKENIITLTVLLLLMLGSIDDAQAIYSNKYFLLPGLAFSRLSLCYAIFHIFMVYLSIERFLSATYSKTKDKEKLENIKSIDSIIIGSALETSNKISEIKRNLYESLGLLLEKTEETSSVINTLKNDLNKSIEYTNEFTAIESLQIHDGEMNIEILKELTETFPNLETAVELQKIAIEKSNETLQESIKNIYNLQSNSKKLVEEYSGFQAKVLDKKIILDSNLNKIESFSQLSIQIHRIIIFMKDISDKTNTLAINSSIQASKSGDWSENFSVVSKEIADLVTETFTATDRLESLLFTINETFKKFNAAKNTVSLNFKELIENINFMSKRINKINEDMGNQNEGNSNIMKNTDKMYNAVSNITSTIIKEEDNCSIIEEKIEELNLYVKDISDKASKQSLELKKLINDMNKILATSNDMKSITNKLNEDMYNFISTSDELENKMTEYTRVII